MINVMKCSLTPHDDTEKNLSLQETRSLVLIFR